MAYEYSFDVTTLLFFQIINYVDRHAAQISGWICIPVIIDTYLFKLPSVKVPKIKLLL